MLVDVLGQVNIDLFASAQGKFYHIYLCMYKYIYMHITYIFAYRCKLYRHMHRDRGLMGHILMGSVYLVVQEIRIGIIARFLNSAIFLLFLKCVVHNIVTLGLNFLLYK